MQTIQPSRFSQIGSPLLPVTLKLVALPLADLNGKWTSNTLACPFVDKTPGKLCMPSAACRVNGKEKRHHQCTHLHKWLINEHAIFCQLY